MSRPVLFSAKKAANLPTGTELVPAYSTGSSCVVESVSKNKREMNVRYLNGGVRTWKISHICKYYVIKDSEKHKRLVSEGVASFIGRKRK